MVLVRTGGQDGVRGFISAFNESSGEELWKTFTIPKPAKLGVPA